MRILLITGMYPPMQTGTANYSYHLADALRKGGHSVQVIAVEHHLKRWMIPLRSFKHFSISSIFPRNYKTVTTLAKFHKSEVILLINQYLDVAFLAVYASKKLGIPLFVSIGTEIQFRNKVKNWVYRQLDRFICGKLIIHNCKGVIAWDSEIQRYVKDVYRADSTIVPFGVAPELYNTDYKHDYSNVKQIIGVGAVCQQRDYLFNIRVFAELLKDFPDLRYKIIGHIYDDRAVKLVGKLGIGQNVIFTGELPHWMVIEELKKSCLHWMQSSCEYKGVGTSTLEAMALGIPVITNTWDVPSFCRIHVWDDIDVAISHIQYTLTNVNYRMSVGKFGMKYVNDKLSWQMIAESITRVFNEKS